MKIIIGLGNPGREYEGTRHNMGYMVVDKLADIVGCDLSRNEFKGIYGIVNNPSLPDKLIIAKPETFMNLSGEFVSRLLTYFKVSVDDLLIVYDDMALKEGVIRLRPDGSSGGQKGMQNIIDLLGTTKIKRIRIGIGEPQHGAIDWVLSKPNKDTQPLIDEATDKAAKAIIEYLKTNFDKAMSKFN